MKKYASYFLTLKMKNVLKSIYSLFHKTNVYFNWADAKHNSVGYDSKIILNEVVNATKKVIDGTSKYERDGVNFEKIQLSWPIVSFFLYLIKSKNVKNISDFGGSLGTTFYQMNSFCDLPEIKKWLIIEQDKFVKAGIKITKDSRLLFSVNIDDIYNENCEVLLLSGILQYIEKPYDMLKKMLNKKIKYVLIDRTSFSVNQDIDEFIIVQEVPKKIYSASYPAWVFNQKKFITFFQKNGFVLKYDFIASDPGSLINNYLGFFFERNNED